MIEAFNIQPMASKSDEELKSVLAALNKNHKNVLRLGTSGEIEKHPAIPTGSLGLDLALGIGGIPRGRMTELYGQESTGKTSISLHIINECQKLGGRAAYIDAEFALDLGYVKALGVDINKLLIAQPDYGEQALDIVEDLVRSGTVDLIVIDSVSALVPKSELEGDMGTATMGVQARLMGQAMRKLNPLLKANSTTLIWINQMRQKLGVMFGCLHYNAKVLLADGTTKKIGKLVNQKIPASVLSVIDGKITTCKIIDWHKNGKAKQFWQVVTENPHGSGRLNIPVGDNHIFITPNGEKEFIDLKVGDQVLTRAPAYFTQEQMEICIGSLLGDGSIRLTKSKLVGRLRLGHGIKQNKYCIEKAQQIYSVKGADGYSNNKYWFDTKSTHELVWLAKYKSNGALQYVDSNLLDNISIRSIAIWYLDDGTFCGSYKKWGWGKSVIYATKLSLEDKERLADRFVHLGLPRPTVFKRGFTFSGENNRIFHEKIAPFAYKSMSYKIHPKLRNKIGSENIITNGHFRDELIPVRILKIYKKPWNDSGQKFDITVEGGHCYFVDNILVHNSPNTVSGGNALKFYASARLEVATTGKNTKDDVTTGVETRVKVVKNKMAPPYKTAEFSIVYGKGIDPNLELMDLGVKYGVIRRAGPWFSMGDTKLAQGRENSAQVLLEDPILTLKVKELIIDKALAGEIQEDQDNEEA